MTRDLFGRPLAERVKQTELHLPGTDAIERQPVTLPSALPMDPLNRDLFDEGPEGDNRTMRERMDEVTRDWTETVDPPAGDESTDGERWTFSFGSQEIGEFRVPRVQQGGRK